MYCKVIWLWASVVAALQNNVARGIYVFTYICYNRNIVFRATVPERGIFIFFFFVVYSIQLLIKTFPTKLTIFRRNTRASCRVKLFVYFFSPLVIAWSFRLSVYKVCVCMLCALHSISFPYSLSRNRV